MATPCDRCGKAEAAIHFTQIQGNDTTTRHLCESCAAALGLDAGTVAAAPLADFIAQMGKAMIGETPPVAGTCPNCGLSIADFKRTGRLGCARCWSTFEPSLKGLLRKLHGGTQHVGKVYSSSAAPSPGGDQAARVGSLRRSLQRAVDEEDFERAAQLRDQIRRLEAQA
jgi:protein arginine kinase activator